MKTILVCGMMIATMSSGCKMRLTNTATLNAAVASVRNLPAISCDKGELMSFHLDDSGLDPADLRVQFQADGSDTNRNYQLVRPTQLSNLRLDTCVTPENRVTLKRAIFIGPDQDLPEVFQLESAEKAKNLEAPIYEDSHRGLVIDMQNKTSGDLLIVRGFAQGDKQFATAALGKKTLDGVMIPTDPHLVFGKLVYGDPW